MVAQKYRWDFIGLSTDEKPTAETSPKVTDGSTYYCSDTSQLYVWCNDQWYEKTATGGGGGGGGGGDTVYSTKNTSNSETGGAVYIGNLNASQEEQPDPTATDSHRKYFWALPYNNTAVPEKGSVNILGQEAGEVSVAIGSNAICRLDSQVAIGGFTLNNYSATYGSAIGYGAQCLSANSVALGHNAKTSRNGEVNVGTGTSGAGYNNTNYRVIGGVHDGQLAQDAVTVNQVNALIDAINTALSTNIPHIGV